jgi:hypothetical protein
MSLRSDSIEIYEYAGFSYRVVRDRLKVQMVVTDGIQMIPIDGQHPAASRERHVRAARTQYLEDLSRGK